jgi:ADP-heptose:LPS heptosyltransferase
MKLGDLIQATPLLSEIKNSYPPLILLVSRPEVALAAKITLLPNDVILIPEEELIKNSFTPKSLNKINDIPKPLSLLVNLSSSESSLNLADKFSAPIKLGPQKAQNRVLFPPAQKLAAAIMAVDRSLGRLNLVDLWRLLAPSAAAATRRLYWPTDPALDADPQALAEALNLKGQDLPLLNFPNRPRSEPLIGLHLGSGHHLRRWPVERFVELAKGLTKTAPGANFVLLGGLGERAMAKRFLDLLGPGSANSPRTLDLTGKTPLNALGSVIKKLGLFVAADTGVTHIAAAVGTQLLAIFGGPALAGETGPYAPGSVMIQGQAPCSPCAENRPCPKKPCPALPQVAPVLRAAQSLIGHLPNGAPGGSPTADPMADALTYLAGSDDLGQTLIPYFETPLTAKDRLALAIREASAYALYPNHAQNQYLNSMENYRPAQNPEAFPDPLPTLKAIASLAFGENSTKNTFLDLARQTLKLIDSKIQKPHS